MRNQAAAVNKMPVTWVVVADSRQAQVYMPMAKERRIPLAGNAKHHHYRETVTRELEPIPGMKWRAESPEIYDIEPGKLATVHESATLSRHMSEPRITLQDEIRQHFMQRIAGQLGEAQAARKFDRLVLVAPPKVLGELKKHLPEHVLKQVIAELAKELTHYNTAALAEHLNDII